MREQNMWLELNRAVVMKISDPMDLRTDARGTVNPPMDYFVLAAEFPVDVQNSGQDRLCGGVLLQDTSCLKKQHLCETELLCSSMEGLARVP